jgi:4-hydroxybenzoate polyprenyltransferase
MRREIVVAAIVQYLAGVALVWYGDPIAGAVLAGSAILAYAIERYRPKG